MGKRNAVARTLRSADGLGEVREVGGERVDEHVRREVKLDVERRVVRTCFVRRLFLVGREKIEVSLGVVAWPTATRVGERTHVDP